MNIAYVVPEFVTEVQCGGLASYINNIATILAKKGHKITVIVKSNVTERFDYKENITVDRVYVDLSNVDSSVPGSFYREWSRVLNGRLIYIDENIEKIDIVQYANWNALAFYRTNIPTVVRISSDLPYWRAANTLSYDTRKEYCCEKMTDFLEEIALMRADKVFGPSQLLANIISKRTGVSIEVLESPFEVKNVKEEYVLYDKVLKGKEYVLSFGNLNLLKGCKLIGDVVYDILNMKENLIYVFAGNDIGWNDEIGKHVSAIEYIKRQAKEYSDRIVYLGALCREQLYPIIRNSLFCIMPSRVDNLPNACIEAMSLGKIVIGTWGASFEQLIVDEVSGFLVEKENRSSLLDACQKVMHMDVHERSKIGLQAIERTKVMAADIIAEKTVTLYEETIRNGNSRNYKKYYDKILKKCNIECY